jgi:SAM-dependent methyltransferase
LPRLLAALRARDYRFTVVTPCTHRSVNARAENFAARNVRDVFGWSRPFSGDVLDRELFGLAQQAGILTRLYGGAAPAWRSLVRVAWLDNTLFLHSAFPTAAPDAVFFGPDTYRFAAAVRRYLAIRATPVRRAIDIGCGSGAAGILIATARPAAEVVLADINPAALVAAGMNACAAGANVVCRASDVLAGVDGLFDLIVANPPYLIDPPARIYRHGGGALGEALSLRILRDSLPHLAPGGGLLLYTGSAIVGGDDLFGAAAGRVLAGSGLTWRYEELDPDVFGEELAGGAYAAADRIAAVLLTVERPA